MEKKFVDKYESLKNAPSLDLQLKQQRGREFENLINDVLEEEGVSLKKAYHTKDNRSEQIDGAIEIDNRILLVETKWVESNLAASDLFAFIGKIENKFFGTLGVFFSKEELSENFINALNKGRRQSVIVIHGNDIEDLFDANNTFNLKDYISHSIRVCSYDNVLHYPIKKYLQIKNDEKSINSSDEVDLSISFIKENLTKNISEEELLLKIESNTQTQNNAVFEKIVSKYSDFYRLNLRNFDFTIISNFNNFLKLFNVDDRCEERVAKNFYTQLIEKDIEIYSRDIFLNFFSKHYSKINLKDREAFEKMLLQKMQLAISGSNWNLENYITDIINPIWTNIKMKDAFKKCYTGIFLRDTSEKFSQKKFANELVNNNDIDSKFAKEWLVHKIHEIKKDNDTVIDDSTARFIAITYSKLNKVIKVEDWLNYVGTLIKETK